MPQKVCPSCRGSGKEDVIAPTRYEPCQYCAGIGRDKSSELLAEPCMYCKGTGRQIVVPAKSSCRMCNGSGRINY